MQFANSCDRSDFEPLGKDTHVMAFRPSFSTTQAVLRLLDLLLAAVGLVLGWPLLAVLCLVSWLDTGATPLIVQQRVGQHQRRFGMLKLRTLAKGAPALAAEFVSPSHVSKVGRLLRASKLDELPQLWNILLGDMSFVGPRPSLPCYQTLIAERAKRGVYRFRPGLTGLGQIHGVTMARPVLLARLDARMNATMGLGAYLKCLNLTLSGRGFGDALGERFSEAMQAPAAGQTRHATATIPGATVRGATVRGATLGSGSNEGGIENH